MGRQTNAPAAAVGQCSTPRRSDVPAELTDETPPTGLSQTVDVKAPLDVARLFVLERHTAEDRTRLLLRYHQGEFIAWEETHYKTVPIENLRAQLYQFLASKTTVDYFPIKPNRRMVDDVVDALKAIAALHAPHVPCWLGSSPPAPPCELINCRNGLLHVPTRRLLTSSPQFFSRNAMEFAYDPAAPRPDGWLAFLASIFDGDTESIEALQEWLGYLLLVDTRLQKALLIVGPKRSGKGTIGRVIRSLVGNDNICSPTLAGLGTQFGLEGLIGKQVAILSDARLSGRADIAAIVENLLRITGEDAISVPRKHMRDWTGQLAVRFVVFTNEIPAFADASGAIASRFVMLQTRRSFLGAEDPFLTDKLLAEIPGIFNWALEGLDRLRARGHFLQPADSREALEQLEILGSPIKAFIADRCVVEPGAEAECSALFDAWQQWCREQNREHPGTLQMFGRNLAAQVAGLKVTQPRRPGGRVRIYQGLRLRDPWEPEP